MKRVNLFFIAAFVAASSLSIVSCGSDEYEAPEVTINYSYQKGTQTVSGTVSKGAIIQNDDLIEGTSINFKVKFTKGSEKMSSVKVESQLDGAANSYVIIDVTGMADGLFNIRGGNVLDTAFSTNVGKVKEVFTFTVTDITATKDGTKGTDVFTLTVVPKDNVPDKPAEGDKFSYTRRGATTFGAQSDPTNPSFYSVADAKTMNLSTARSNPSKVNLAFFFGTENGVGNPGTGNSDVVNAIKYGTTTNTTTSWSCPATTLAKVSNSSPLDDKWWQSGVDALKSGKKEVTGLAPNDAVFFKVGDIEYAFIVVSAAGNASGSFIVQFVDRTPVSSGN